MPSITDLHFCPCRNALSKTMGWLLALDGATEHLALALVAPDGRVHAQELAGGAQASAKLLPSLKAWMAAQGVQAGQLAGLVLGRGPGAFTGLRAVAAVAQGLAWGWNLRVIPVDSLLLPVEAGAPPQAQRCAAIVDARMGEVYAAQYERVADGGWRCVHEPALWAPARLRECWQGTDAPQHWLGNAHAMLGLPEPSALPPGARAAALGRIGWTAWREGQGGDPAAALPCYVRDKVALTTAERAALAAAGA